MTGQSNNLPTVAVILAGGTGQRVGMKLPKQLLKIAGKSIIEHTLEVFERCELIDEVIVLMATGFVPQVEKIVANRGMRKVTRVIEGGATRSETTQRAIDLLDGRECNVLFHDAVRPLVDERILADCVAALRDYEAIDVAIPSADTIIMVEQNGDGEVIRDIPDRTWLRRGQTPQGFRLSTIRRAYQRAAADPLFTTTDDCGVVRRYLPEVPIFVVGGSEHNMKVTHPIDVYLADRLFQLVSNLPPEPASADAYRARLAGSTMVVFGGSYGIGHEIAELARQAGAEVFSFSRSTTGTHVENTAQVQAALAQAYERTGRIDYVVNAAGVLKMGPLAETDDAVIEEAIRVNYLAPVQIARASLEYLRRTQGSLLLFTSSSYTRGRANYSLYSSAKAAVVNLTQALADEWSDLGVRVNCVNPERTQTPMRTRAFGEEPPDTLLSAEAVAQTSIDVIISSLTGQVIDVRRVSVPESRPDSGGTGGPGEPGVDSETEADTVESQA